MKLLKSIFTIFALLLNLNVDAQNNFPKFPDNSYGIIWSIASGNVGFEIGSLSKKNTIRYALFNYNYKKTPINLITENSVRKYVSNGKLLEASGLELGFGKLDFKKNNISIFSTFGFFVDVSPNYHYQIQKVTNNLISIIDTTKPATFGIGFSVNIGSQYFLNKNVCIGIHNKINISRIFILVNPNSPAKNEDGFIWGFINPTISIKFYF